MLDHKTKVVAHKVGFRPSEIIVAFGDEPNDTLAVVLPSAEELRSFETARKGQLSIRELLKGDPFELNECYSEEARKLGQKFDRFRSSATFLTHLGEMKFMSGEPAAAQESLEAAFDVRNEAFLRHEVGAVQLSRGREDEAWATYFNCDLKDDISANLRLAQILTRKNDVDGAQKYVTAALAIDTTDYRARMFDGAIQLWKGEWERAIRSLRVAAETRDNSSVLFVNLAAAYWAIGEEHKAVRSLKQATVLNPLNENAVLFYSDVMFLKGAPRACIGALEAILEFEQKNDALWARAARAYYEIARNHGGDRREFQSALRALKNQAAIREDSGVWNNMGVVHSSMQQPSKALRYFSRAFATAQELSEDEDVPFSNLLSSLVELRKYREVYDLSSAYLKARGDDASPSKALAWIFVHHIISVEAIGERGTAARTAERLLDKGLGDQESYLELLIHLFYFRTLIEPDKRIIEKYLPKAVDMLETTDGLSDGLRCRALNNIVFALLMFDELDKVRPFLGEFGRWVHSDIYATATFGLYHLKKGNLERAQELYKEAISLAKHKFVKSRVRQRMLIEFAKASEVQGEFDKAIRYLDKALKQKDGFKYAEREARRLIDRLPRQY